MNFFVTALHFVSVSALVAFMAATTWYWHDLGERKRPDLENELTVAAIWGVATLISGIHPIASYIAVIGLAAFCLMVENGESRWDTMGIGALGCAWMAVMRTRYLGQPDTFGWLEGIALIVAVLAFIVVAVAQRDRRVSERRREEVEDLRQRGKNPLFLPLVLSFVAVIVVHLYEVVSAFIG